MPIHLMDAGNGKSGRKEGHVGRTSQKVRGEHPMIVPGLPRRPGALTKRNAEGKGHGAENGTRKSSVAGRLIAAARRMITAIPQRPRRGAELPAQRTSRRRGPGSGKRGRKSVAIALSDEARRMRNVTERGREAENGTSSKQPATGLSGTACADRATSAWPVILSVLSSPR